ncbi:MAG: hypothetical protein methR_P1247 [Methyloprofundus sp.]|nr:MAG: hypothetical protein methR_P1247 [Methyloprofundus sp.]
MIDYKQFKNRLKKRPHILRLLILLGLVVTIYIVAHVFKLYLPELEKQIQNLGAFAFIGFILLFVLATPFFISVDTLCFAAGLLFPLFPGIFYVAIATYIAAAVIFIMGRYFFREKVELLMRGHSQFAKLDSILAHNDLKIMFLLRLLPLPFALLSYAFSITHVKFKPYLIATSGILIYNTALVYFGYASKHVITAINSGTSTGVSHDVMLFIVGIISITLLIFAIRKARYEILQIAPELVSLKR